MDDAQDQNEAETRRRGQAGIGKTRNEQRGPRQGAASRVQQAEPRLSGGYIGVMLCISLFFDVISGGLGLLPGVGDVISDIFIDPFAFIIITWMFKRKGVDFSRGSTLTSLIVPFLAKLIPILSIFPDFTADVLLVSLADRRNESGEF